MAEDNQYKLDVIGVKPGVSFQRSYGCFECGQWFPEEDIEWFRGKPYGVPCGCNADIESILRQENAREMRTMRLRGDSHRG